MKPEEIAAVVELAEEIRTHLDDDQIGLLLSYLQKVRTEKMS